MDADVGCAPLAGLPPSDGCVQRVQGLTVKPCALSETGVKRQIVCPTSCWAKAS